MQRGIEMGDAGSKRRNHLLVIEDNPADIDLLRRALATADLDCELTVVDDGAEALALFRPGANTTVPDLAIVDLNLPKHSGLEVIAQMRANPTFAQVPVVIMSSSSAPRDRSSLEKFQIRGYIVKPADLEEFMRIGRQIRELLAPGSTQGQRSRA
jgi:two-component system, chemotaxis family, response regulator Rcp1